MRVRVFALALIGVWVAGAGADSSALLVTVGEVTESSAVMWVRGREPSVVSLAYARIDGGEERRASVTPAPAADHTGKLRLTGLEPATRHRYRLSQGPPPPGGEVVTAPAPPGPTPLAFPW